MEEPLLGSWKRPSLSQIPEDGPAEDVATPSSLKERIIFGSPDFCPNSDLVWLDYGFILEEGTGNLNETSQTASQGNVTAFDDSFVDSLIMGSSHRKHQTTSDDLIRLDLDVCTSSQQVEKRSISQLADRRLDNAARSTTAEEDHHHHTSKKHLHRSRTAPAMTVMAEKLQSRVRLPPFPASLSVASQAFIGLLVYLAVGVLLYIWKEDEFSGTMTHSFIDALYFCIVTLCTIGYGDITPATPMAKLFSCIFVLVGFGFIDILLSGMVSYVLDRQEALLLSAVSVGHHEIARNYLVDIKKGRMRIRSKVALAFGVVTLCIGVGTFVMHFVESLGWLDSFYLSCMSVTTVGYGDHAFSTLPGRLFASIWLLVSTLAVARSFLYLAEARIDKRHRLIAKMVLQKEMTIGDLVAADLDNDGSVSKSDFVVYKLKQMGKIEEKDIFEVCRQFTRLDSENSGKITLSCLINHHQSSTLK